MIPREYRSVIFKVNLLIGVGFVNAGFFLSRIGRFDPCFGVLVQWCCGWLVAFPFFFGWRVR